MADSSTTNKAAAYTGLIGVGLALGVLSTVAVAWIWGPRTIRSERDPITNRYRQQEVWLSITIRDESTEDDVSRWVDSHLPGGMYLGQYGWLASSTTHHGWFGPTSIACGGPGAYPAIPALIYDGTITADGMTRDQLLEEFLAGIPAAYREHQTLRFYLDSWRQRAEDATPATPVGT